MTSDNIYERMQVKIGKNYFLTLADYHISMIILGL